MTTSQEQWLNPTEFANRYNRSRPLGKDFMPLEPSFVKLLCEQGKLEHSVLPSHDGRKKDVYKIPEYELETVDILLNDESKDPKPENGIMVSEEKLMTSAEVAKFLSLNPCYVTALAKEGKIKGTKVPRGKNTHGGRGMYMFKEEDVLAYYEKRENRKHANTTSRKRKPNDGFTDLKKMDCDGETKAYIMQLEAKNNELMASNASYADLINSLRKDLTTLEEEKANWLISSEGNIVSSSDKDIFEAYRRGFKDGFEMGGNK